MREYLVLEYAASKNATGQSYRCCVPTDQLDQVSSYVGGGGAVAVQGRGGADWTRQAQRQKAVKEIANELIRLYSARMASKGHAFGPDTRGSASWRVPVHRDPDQLTTIDEVKADMERPIPMDRLISRGRGLPAVPRWRCAPRSRPCRTASRWRCVLTTLLAEQHSRRPPAVLGLPRAPGPRSPASRRPRSPRPPTRGRAAVRWTRRRHPPAVEQGDAVQEPGPAIIDEEQRFGVEHKEKLKAMRTDVDVLAMSATTPTPPTWRCP
ncbi:CarD family transcriptional regulator [Kocuria rhizophila]|nr:CarD family transcriptional regulator [Kocuria rhizophila]